MIPNSVMANVDHVLRVGRGELSPQGEAEFDKDFDEIKARVVAALEPVFKNYDAVADIMGCEECRIVVVTLAGLAAVASGSCEGFALVLHQHVAAQEPSA